MLAGGEAAPEFAERLKPLGFSIEIAAREIGVVSATKMFRSIMAKGMEALITECVLGASRNGAEPRVFASLAESFPGNRLAEAIVRRMDWSARLGLKQRFGGEATQSYREVLDAVAQVSDLR